MNTADVAKVFREQDAFVVEKRDIPLFDNTEGFFYSHSKDSIKGDSGRCLFAENQGTLQLVGILSGTNHMHSLTLYEPVYWDRIRDIVEKMESICPVNLTPIKRTASRERNIPPPFEPPLL